MFRIQEKSRSGCVHGQPADDSERIGAESRSAALERIVETYDSNVFDAVSMASASRAVTQNYDNRCSATIQVLSEFAIFSFALQIEYMYAPDL
jgi:hypothetical protein